MLPDGWARMSQRDGPVHSSGFPIHHCRSNVLLLARLDKKVRSVMTISRMHGTTVSSVLTGVLGMQGPRGAS